MSELTPLAGTTVYFAAATAIAERIDVKKRRVRATGAHRGELATLDNGRLIMDKRWYSVSP